MIFYILFISLVSTAAEKTPILSLQKSMPQISESYLLFEDKNYEYLYVSSNRFMDKKREYGLYKRRKIKKHLLFANVAKSSNKNTRKVASVSPHAWKVSVFGQSIDSGNPRQQDLFQWIVDELPNKGWQKENVREIELDGLEIIIKSTAQGKTSIQKKPYFKHCKTTYAQRPICRFEDGFIFLE
jgi:hypothetical protein